MKTSSSRTHEKTLAPWNVADIRSHTLGAALDLTARDGQEALRPVQRERVSASLGHGGEVLSITGARVQPE